VVTWLAPLVVALLCVGSELLHAQRQGRVAYLAFGPSGRPRRWVPAAAVARVLAVAAVCWGLVVLWKADAAPWSDALADGAHSASLQHLVLALDVSPSMQLADAGPASSQTRAERARDVLRSVLLRLDLVHTRISVVAFYTEARPVVIDTADPEVVANILNDLPLEHAFAAGKTQMHSSLEAAAKIAHSQRWPAGTATLVMVTDGDTLPASKAPTLPPAFGHVLIAGVGNSYRGLFIDGHSSRQDAASLQRLALQLGGAYNDVNSRHVPSEILAQWGASLPRGTTGRWARTEWAMAAVAVGAAVLALLPLAVVWFGAAWSPRAADPVESWAGTHG
jgi:Ca-activated chloride channel family protein